MPPAQAQAQASRRPPAGAAAAAGPGAASASASARRKELCAGVGAWHREALAELRRRREEAARKRIELLKSSDMQVGCQRCWLRWASRVGREGAGSDLGRGRGRRCRVRMASSHIVHSLYLAHWVTSCGSLLVHPQSYLALVSQERNSRLSGMLRQTDDCLRTLAARLERGSAGLRERQRQLQQQQDDKGKGKDKDKGKGTALQHEVTTVRVE